MTTIVIAQDITATLTERKARQYFAALDADKNLRSAYRNEDFDWEDLQDFQVDAWEAWEEFFS